jgi:Lar family restriction alleviation protein
MSEQYETFKPCPFCGGAANTGHSIFTKSVQDFFSVACVDCGSRLGDFRDIEKALQCWNQRVYTNDEAKIILSSRVEQAQHSKPSLFKSATFFYWFSCVFFALQAFFYAGFQGAFWFFGIYALGFAVFRFFSPGPIDFSTLGKQS